ncbi:MAG TPA: hypothetical protein DCQ77_11640 [Betaproteobacteria bacterium]|nr:hypothetical protein [Betaproteobacteria bacterium]
MLVLAADVHSKGINAKIPPNPQQGAGQQLRIPPYEAELKKHILTNLYRARPAWQGHAQQALGSAVANADGCTDYTGNMPDAEMLRRWLSLNLKRR